MSSSRVFRACGALMAAAKTTSKPKSILTSRTSKAVAAAKEKEKRAAPAPRPSSGNAFLKPIPVSPALQNFLGVPEISRTQAVKKIWDHIKANSLQNPANKREIQCDEKLKAIFDGKDKVGMLEIAKLLNPHFIKTN